VCFSLIDFVISKQYQRQVCVHVFMYMTADGDLRPVVVMVCVGFLSVVKAVFVTRFLLSYHQ